MSAIHVGGETDFQFSGTEAKEIIAGYCFGAATLGWQPRIRRQWLEKPPGLRPDWAYRVYDCVPGMGGMLDLRDVLLTAGINSRVDQRSAAGVFAILPEVNEALASLPEDGPDRVVFWELPPEELSVPPAESVARRLWQAWWLLTAVDQVGTAIAHKILHHKRPAQFPLLDSKTGACYPGSLIWGRICEELQRHEAEFADLERWFADLAAHHGGVPLTRLRLHDILVWTACTGQAQKAVKAGREVLAG